MKVILIGPPGAGKGTQAELLSKELNIPRLSVGALLRKNIKEQTPEGKEAEDFVKKGLNVPPDILFRLLKPWFEEHRDGFIVDNLPRSHEQLQAFKSFITENRYEIDCVFHLVVSEEIAVERLMRRATERRKRGEARIDETEEVIKKRYRRGYVKEIGAILDYFKDMGKLVEIDGEQSINEVHADIISHIRELR